MSELQLFPPVKPSDPSTWPSWGSRWHGFMSPDVAKSLPAVGRAVALIAGQLQQMPLDDYRGVTPLARPRILEAPDPDQSRAWFVGVQAEDWLLNGNAVSYVTTRDVRGMPATVSWLPAAWVTVTIDPRDGEVRYWVGGRELDPENVTHVKRGADRMNVARGVGVVEQHLDALGKVRDQHRYEADVSNTSAVPSVAVITPNPRLSNTEADAAKVDWVEKFAGPTREPAILPAGTQVIPLAWSPSDSQLVEARQLSLVDVANIFNLDAYHLGAPSGSHTYKSPGPLFLQLLRQTLEPILAVFEDVWSAAWLPRGRRVRFDRRAVLADTMQTQVATATSAVEAGLWTVEEARVFLGMSPDPLGAVSTTSPVATVENDSTGSTDDTTSDAQEVAPS